MMVVAGIAAGLLGLAGPALAASVTTAGAPPACAESARTQPEMTACARTDATAADRRLSAAYRELLRYVEGSDRRRLVAAQRAWLAFRDADCAFFSGGGGSIAPMNAAVCRADRSRTRAEELESWPPNAPRSALVPLG
jgi:uncharacterized protein YecT (DUF1311 family)